MEEKRIRKILFSVLVSAAVFVVMVSTVLVGSQRARALILPIIPFGGRVLAMIPCTCPTDIGKFTIFVGPPKPIVAVFDFRFALLTLKMWYNLTIGQKVLGYAELVAPGVCWQINPAAELTGVPCIPSFVGPYIFVVGTTLVAPPGPP